MGGTQEETQSENGQIRYKKHVSAGKRGNKASEKYTNTYKKLLLIALDDSVKRALAKVKVKGA